MPFRNYSFLDQFENTTIDLTDYVKKFSNITYDLTFQNDQPLVITMKDMFSHLDIAEDYKDRGAAFEGYNIQEGELIEDVAISVYGSEDFWWVICLFNNITNPLTDWPITDDQIHYIIDNILLSKENKYSAEGYYKVLFDMNEQRRTIEVLKQEQLPDLVWQFKNKLNVSQITTEFTITL